MLPTYLYLYTYELCTYLVVGELLGRKALEVGCYICRAGNEEEQGNPGNAVWALWLRHHPPRVTVLSWSCSRH